MTTPVRTTFLILATALLFPGCAFFNTYYNARKAYENGLQGLKQTKEQAQEQNMSAGEIAFDRFSLEPKTGGGEAKQFFDIAIEKANKVVSLHPQSGWVENAIFLLGKSYYMRASGNDYYDAQNRLEVFMIRFPESKFLPEVKLWYGKTLMKLKLDDEAKKTFLQIPSLTADNSIQAEALIYLGDLSVNEANYSAAAEHYAKASALASEKNLKQHAIFKAAYSYFKTGNYKLAENYFEALEKTDPNFNDRFDILLMKARALKLDGQYDKAIGLLDNVIGDLRYKNYFIRAEFEIADALRLKGNSLEAEDQFNYVISTYNNPNFNDDAYYFLGLINDAPPVTRSDGFFPSLHLAKKYYNLVKTGYPSSNYFQIASARYDYLMRIDFLKGAIRVDEILLNRARCRSANPDSALTPIDIREDYRQDSVQSLKEERQMQQAALKLRKGHHAINTSSLAQTTAPADTLRKTRRDSSALKTKDGLFSKGLAFKDTVMNAGLPTDTDAPVDTVKSHPLLPGRGGEKKDTRKDEFAEVKIVNSELLAKLASVQMQMDAFDQVKNVDSLKEKEKMFFDQEADDYADLADYFYDLRQDDSAQFYYRLITDRFSGSASDESALYARARFEQKANNPDYLAFYRSAYTKFPNGKLASIGRQFLNIEAPVSDSSQYRYEQAEKSFLKNSDYASALRWYQSVATDSASRFRLSALYAMGLLCEKKLADYARAFRLYNTLLYAAPNSEWARRAKPKIAAYIHEKNISEDSLIYWVDTSYVSVTRFASVSQASKTLDSASLGTGSDTTQQAKSLLPLDKKSLLKVSDGAKSDSAAVLMEEFLKSLQTKKSDKEKKVKKKDQKEKTESDETKKKSDEE